MSWVLDAKASPCCHCPACRGFFLPGGKTMQNIFMTPNKWVTESKLIELTGLRPGTIMRARRESWLVGREYVHVAPDENPKPNSECMYNRWVERQVQKKPGAV